MGWVKREAKAFTKEFARQGCILFFGKYPKRLNPSYKNAGRAKQYYKSRNWSRRNHYK